MNLEGKAALVTGGARRIGRAIAVALAERGARVAVACARGTAEQPPAEVVLKADLADPAARATLVPRALEALGRLDILVNNAAVYDAAPLEEMDEQRWNRTLEVNLTAPFFLAREAGLWMRRAGSGVVINLTDWGIARPYPNRLAYYAAKAGLASATAGLARALAPEVRVNAVAPGAILLQEDAPPSYQEAVLEATPLGRLGGEDAVVSTVVFLIGNDFVTGETITVDGGRSLR